jgi:nucleotide-binding universal stress UspA family protein
MNIIVAFDASEESKNALKAGLQLARQTSGTLTAVHSFQKNVIETARGSRNAIIEDFDTAVARSERVIAAAEKIADEQDVDITTKTLHGDPVEKITDYAHGKDDTTIYVGHRKVAATKAAVGSVAQRLIKDSPVPVTVVN